MTSKTTTVIDEPLIGIPEVCAMLGLGRTWVYEHVKRGQLPHFRIEGALRFRRSEILDWIEDHRAEPTNVRAIGHR